MVWVFFLENLFANYVGKINIWSSTNKPDICLPQTGNLFCKSPPLITYINGT